MIEKDHIEHEVAQHVPAALQKQAAPAIDPKAMAEEVIDFYLKSPEYAEVHLVTCNSCGELMCIEVLNPAKQSAYMAHHHQGRQRITLGNTMLSHRKRLDGAMGYRCICGNNSILSSVEKGVIPQSATPMPHVASIEPHHEAMVQIQMAKTGYKPDVEVNGNKIRIETFTVERLK